MHEWQAVQNTRDAEQRSAWSCHFVIAEPFNLCNRLFKWLNLQEAQ